jgi:hypothetical protein
MSKIIVYQVKLYNVVMDELLISRRMATKKGATIMGGHIVEETGIEIDADQLERGEEWTKRDFMPKKSSSEIPDGLFMIARLLAKQVAQEMYKEQQAELQREAKRAIGKPIASVDKSRSSK